MIVPDLPITAFEIGNEVDGISLTIEELFGFPDMTGWNGFEAAGVLGIHSGNYSYRGTVYFTTGELSIFYNELIGCYNTLRGSATFYNFEENTFYMEVTVGKRGEVICTGWSYEHPSIENKLSFEIHTDQTFLLPAIQELKGVTEYFFK